MIKVKFSKGGETMKKKILQKSNPIFFLLLIIIGIAYGIFFTVPNNVEALSKYGSRGNEVTQIQTKLKRWGYYKGSIDGIYGSQTVAAVKYFQRKNGLSQDGIAGPKTLAAMGIMSSSSGSSSSSVSNSNDVNLIARAIHGEARGEPYNRKSCSRCSNIKQSKRF